MRKPFKFSLLVMAFATIQASADQAKQCQIHSILGFGQSLTLGMPTQYRVFAPAYEFAVSKQEQEGTPLEEGAQPLKNFKQPLRDYPWVGYGRSPIEYLAQNYGAQNSSPRVKILAKFFVGSDADSGATQVDTMLAAPKKATWTNWFNDLMVGNLNTEFKRADLVVGLDAFYIDASNTDLGSDGQKVCSHLPEKAAALIAAGEREHKILMLGNIPNENSYNVRIAGMRVGPKKHSYMPDLYWFAPDQECAQAVNATLQALCTPSRGCYVIDLKSMVDTLACGESLYTEDGQGYKLYQMRPDGIHLSKAGSRYVGELMVKALNDNPPPACAR